MKIFNLLNRCNHEWRVLVNKTMPSPFEQTKVTKSAKSSIPSWYFTKQSIIILECKKCGKINKTITTNP